MLYLVATPIGNLADITYRAVETLKNCDYILCEDTRHTSLLLKHYDIQKPLKSFHKFNEASKQEEILSDLKQGLAIALVSDAGTPGISDPGSSLVQACIAKQISISPLPGPCAVISALCCSGLDTNRFQFCGFLPRKAGQIRKAIQDVLCYSGTTLFYESPHRLTKTLQQLAQLAPERELTVAREMTKKFEEFYRGTASNQFKYWKSRPLRGEIVILIAGNESIFSDLCENLTPQEQVEWMQNNYQLNRKEAIQMVAKTQRLSKRAVYKSLLHLQNSLT